MHNCTAGNGSLRNKMSNGFEHFSCYLYQLRTIDRLATFRVQLNLLRVRSNWHVSKNAVSLRLICGLSSLLDSHCFYIIPSSSLVFPSQRHTYTYKLGCGQFSVFFSYWKPNSQSPPCTSLFRLEWGYNRGEVYRSETVSLPLYCQVFILRNKMCPFVCFSQAPKIGNEKKKINKKKQTIKKKKKKKATKGIRAMIWESGEETFSSLS